MEVLKPNDNEICDLLEERYYIREFYVRIFELAGHKEVDVDVEFATQVLSDFEGRFQAVEFRGNNFIKFLSVLIMKVSKIKRSTSESWDKEKVRRWSGILIWPV